MFVCVCVLYEARGDETIFFSDLLFSDYRRRFGIALYTCIYYTRGICLCSLFATIIATRSPASHPSVTTLITKKPGFTHTGGRSKRPVREGAAVCPYCDALYIHGRCRRRRHCYEGAFRDVTLNPKYKCKILLKSPDTGAPPVVPLLCHYIHLYIYILYTCIRVVFV